MKFNKTELVKNLSFFIFCITALVLLTVVSLVFDSKAKRLDEEELSDKNVSINSLVINELMSSNKGVIAADDGELYDYVELYNGNSKDINLKNYGLSDEKSGVKWVFPDITIESKSYLVVFLTGKKQAGLKASFKLSSGGDEVMTLFKPNGKVVDAVETVALSANTVMARNTSGTWVVMPKPTPGFANTVEGYNDFIKSLTATGNSSLVINEILPNNKGNFKNNLDEYSGYIEIKNVGNETIKLDGYGLSDSESVSYKWHFPKGKKLSPNELLVIYTSGKSLDGEELCASFKLESKNGVVILTNNKGQVIEKVEYENVPNGIAYVKNDGTFTETSAISPGYENDAEGIDKFQKKYQKLANDLVITEVMNSNYSYLAQNGNNYYDWIELYNNSKKKITLSNYCLTTSTNDICAYKLPKVELDAGKYYIIMASGNEQLSNDSYKHANFKLSDTETLYLTKDRKVVDTLIIHDVPKGYSFGKGEYGTYYYSSPTPGTKNSSGTHSRTAAPKATKTSGIFNNSNGVEVALSGSGKIYYTLDGSEPSIYSNVYSSPLNIKSTTVLRIMAKQDDMLKSAVNTYSYIVNENHKLDVISISMNPSDFTDLNKKTSALGYVKKINIELINQDGSEGFQEEAGIKLFGGSTRFLRKKSYEVKFKKQYGSGHLEYKLFDGVDSAVYNSFVLRTGSQDEFSYSKNTMLRDIMATSILKEHTTVDVQDYKPVVLYVNGQYWGLYFIREKVDETFVANHYNVDANKQNTDILRIDGDVKSGSATKYNNMIKWINSNSLSNQANYEKIKEQVDIQNLCDFWIAEIYATNYDILNTRYFSNPNVDNGKWKFIFYDLDSGYYNSNNNYFNYYVNTEGIGAWYFSTALLRNLNKNSEFRKTYLERTSYNLRNTWNYETVSAKLDQLIEEISEDEFRRNFSRWNNMSYEKFLTNINYLKAFAKERDKYIRRDAKSFFKLSNDEYNKYFG